MISADGTRLFIANEDAGQATVLDVNTGNTVKQIKVGGEPEGVDISPDGRFVYVTTGRGGTLARIDPTKNEVVGTMEVGERPWGVVVVP